MKLKTGTVIDEKSISMNNTGPGEEDYGDKLMSSIIEDVNASIDYNNYNENTDTNDFNLEASNVSTPNHHQLRQWHTSKSETDTDCEQSNLLQTTPLKSPFKNLQQWMFFGRRQKTESRGASTDHPGDNNADDTSSPESKRNAGTENEIGTGTELGVRKTSVRSVDSPRRKTSVASSEGSRKTSVARRRKFNYEKYMKFLELTLETVGFSLARVTLTWDRVSFFLALLATLVGVFGQSAVLRFKEVKMQSN